MSAPRHLHKPQDTLDLTAATAARDPVAVDACRRLLLPLRQGDAQRGGDLEKTLRTYYACGGSVSRSAEALFLHRNSVRYRLDRVRALLGVDIDDPSVCATLIVALAVDLAAARNEETQHATERAK